MGIGRLGPLALPLKVWETGTSGRDIYHVNASTCGPVQRTPLKA